MLPNIKNVITDRNTSASDLYTLEIPSSARSEGVKFSWTQESGFRINEAVWQLDNVAVLYANEIDSALLDTFSGTTQASSVMLFSGGSIQVCAHTTPCLNNHRMHYLYGKTILLFISYIIT